MAQGGKKLTKEHKEKLRQAKLKNPVRYWLGKSFNDETKKKISETLKEKFKNGELKPFWMGHPAWNRGKTIDRDKYPNMGHQKPHTEEAKKKMSIIHKGKTPNNKGKKCPQTSEKAKKNQYGNYFSKGCKPWNTGLVGVIKKSEIAKKKMRVHWENKEWREKQVKLMLASLFKRPTSLEREMIQIIEKYKLPYKYVGDGSFLIGYKNPDFININGEKKLIEVGNVYHHQGDYIEKRKAHFTRYGWESYFFITNKLEENKIIYTLNGGRNAIT